MAIQVEYTYKIAVCADTDATYKMIRQIMTMISTGTLQLTIEEQPLLEGSTVRCTNYTFRADDNEALTICSKFLADTFNFLGVDYTE